MAALHMHRQRSRGRARLGRPLTSPSSHLWTISASLSHLAAMSASIAFTGSVGACSANNPQQSWGFEEEH